MSKAQKRALETASLSQSEEDQPTVVSSANGAKIQQNPETTNDSEGNNKFFKTSDGQAYGFTWRGKIDKVRTEYLELTKESREDDFMTEAVTAMQRLKNILNRF